VGEHILLFGGELPTPPGPFGFPALDLSAVQPYETKTPGSASLAAQACALAARAVRHPLSSAMHAIECERIANGINNGDYARKWLWSVLQHYASEIERISKERRVS
jgi:hypothetical protein